MFSQFRASMENLSQPRSPLEASSRNHSRHSSLVDLPSTLYSLSENPLAVGIRRTFSGQGSTSPAPKPVSPNFNGDRSAMKSRLEERLRAAAAGASIHIDTLREPSPDKSAKSSPLSTVHSVPLSPRSTPLPDSPPLSPATKIHAPLPRHSRPNGSILHDDYPGDAPLPSSPTDQSEYSLYSAATHLTPDGTVDVPDPLAAGQPSLLPQAGVTTEALQERLKLVERRFSDVSKSFKRLQAEKAAADALLREFTPVITVKDIEGLRGYLRDVKSKAETSKDEIDRLSKQLERQEVRMEELRDTHRLETDSRTEQVDRLRTQLTESEALLKATQDQAIQGQGHEAIVNSQIEHLRKEVEQMKRVVKDEEEKRSKAISLLKTVRQKLVKSEKEKEDVARELGALKEKDREARQKEAQEKAQLQQQIETTNNERDSAQRSLRVQFERDNVALRTRFEKETAAVKAQLELEMVTLNAAHAKEMQAKTSQLNTSEKLVATLTGDKNELFDQLQLRQAEIESLRSHNETLEGQKTELEYQIRGLEDRLALVNEDLAEARRNSELNVARSPSTSAEDVARLVSVVEQKYEAQLAEMRRSMSTMEKERSEAEAGWHKKLQERVKEIEELRATIDSTTRLRLDGEHTVGALQAEIEKQRGESDNLRQDIAKLRMQIAQAAEDKSDRESLNSQLQLRMEQLEKDLEEARGRETQARSNNKALREELRKVQNSAALLERQRNPGVGHWQTRQDGERQPPAAVEAPANASKPRPSDEEVNLEYLRNVILQFLEHKEMRPNLVRVLSIILHFTPQETRRLMAKV